MQSDLFRNQHTKVIGQLQSLFYLSPEFPRYHANNRSENWRISNANRDLPNTLKIEIGTIENSRTQPEICLFFGFVCVNTEKQGYVFFFVSDVILTGRQPEIC